MKKHSKVDVAANLSTHLTELRNRIMVVLAALVVSIIIGFQFAPYIVEQLVQIAKRYGYALVYLAPAELFGQYIKVTLVMSVSVIMPFILYQLWAFCRPGLKDQENKYFVRTMIFGFLCFVIGVVFAYYTILPFMLQFFIQVNISSTIQASISVSNYISFILSTFLTFGIIFEMPVVISTLTGLGLLTPKLLTKSRKVVIVLIFFICAIITPPDVVSQVMMAIPMVLLYELSARISSIIYKRKHEKEARRDK